MWIKSANRRPVCAVVLLGAALLGGCAAPQSGRLAKLWPFGKRPEAPPAPVEILTLSALEAQTAVPSVQQFLERNTLVIDLRSGGSRGGFVAQPAAGERWPVRIAFRALAGQFGQLEVRGAQRALLPLHAAGAGPVDIPLSFTVWSQDTSQLRVEWGPAESVALADR
ncbi:MAG: hypothetical protein NZM12_14270 [Steroidobacteraceae bacterium]|nr:hypothetical protein [Steroidobacteraceae bacterium]MDW8259672.1 hypothetical protein [Gammaproteobacteria bacterium]